MGVEGSNYVRVLVVQGFDERQPLLQGPSLKDVIVVGYLGLGNQKCLIRLDGTCSGGIDT